MPRISEEDRVIRLLVLDVDGVLNGHQWIAEAGSCDIRRECVRQLNRILDATGCKILLASAWRYMVLQGAMTLDGFGYMLRTHGAATHTGVIVGTTRADDERDDDDFDGTERGRQVREWLREHPEFDRFVAIDDAQLGYQEYGVPLVMTDGRVGMTAKDADRAIVILKGED